MRLHFMELGYPLYHRLIAFRGHPLQLLLVDIIDF